MIKLICKGLWNIDVITGDFSERNEVKVFILANERMCALSALGMSAIRTNDEALFSLNHYLTRKISFSTLNTSWLCIQKHWIRNLVHTRPSSWLPHQENEEAGCQEKQIEAKMLTLLIQEIKAREPLLLTQLKREVWRTP